MAGKTTLQIYGSATFRTKRTGRGFWISECDDLGITLQSGSGDEVMEDIESALELLLRDLHETQELETFASEHGWSIVHVEHAPAISHGAIASGWMPAPDRENRIRVPIVPFLPEWAGAQA